MKPKETPALPAKADLELAQAAAPESPGPAAAASMAGTAAGGPDLLLPAATGTPPARDLLYDIAKACQARTPRDELGAGRETAPAQAAGPQTRQRRALRMPPPGFDCGLDEPASTAEGARDRVQSAPASPAGPCEGLLGPAGRRAGIAAGAKSGSDALLDRGERLHRVAVVADIFIAPLRPPKMARLGSLPPPRPKSKAECERRCGSDGFCDPSSLLGCGGMHCGRQRDILF